MQKELKEAVIKTLIYSDIFDYPLTVEELIKFLIGYQLSPKQKDQFCFFATPTGPAFEFNNGFFHLPQRGEVVAKRRKLYEFAKAKLQKAARIAEIFRFIPWIRLVAVTGAVAAGNPDSDSDIDLLLVVDGGRVWLTRFLVLGLLQLFNQRVHIAKNKLKDRLCINIFLPSESLTYPDQNLFAANELARMKVVFERDNYYQKLIRANRWVFKWLPNWKRNAKCKMQNAKSKPAIKNFIHPPCFIFKNTFRFSIWSVVLDRLEVWLRTWQVGRIQKNFPQTKNLSFNQLLIFQPNDVKERILAEYRRRIGDSGLLNSEC